MESGNSGSLQSSSGGDEEYDSRAESISAFLNPLPPPSNHHTSSLFESQLANYFDPQPPQISNPTSFLNLDIDWSKTLRSDPDCAAELQTTTGTTTTATVTTTLPFSEPLRGGGAGTFLNNNNHSSPPLQIPYPPPPPSENGPRGSAPAADHASNTTAVRNPKKRSRASRRAPTTVLTTDTTNFRAMVQEFTGIPAPPFTAASHPFPRSRLDLFGAPSSLRSNPFGDTGTTPYSLLRPFAQKLPQHQQQPPLFIPSNNNVNDNAAAAAPPPSTTPFSFEIEQHHHQNLNLLSMQMPNPILTFQSLLQSPTPPPKYPLADINTINQFESLNKSHDHHHHHHHHNHQEQQQSDSTHVNKMESVLEEFGLGQAQLGHSNGTASSRGGGNSSVLPPSWADGGGGRSNGGDQSINGGSGYGGLQRSISNDKLEGEYPAVADFLGDLHSNSKVSENINVVSSRSEGMVESWICSSD